MRKTLATALASVTVIVGTGLAPSAAGAQVPADPSLEEVAEDLLAPLEAVLAELQAPTEEVAPQSEAATEQVAPQSEDGTPADPAPAPAPAPSGNGSTQGSGSASGGSSTTATSSGASTPAGFGGPVSSGRSERSRAIPEVPVGSPLELGPLALPRFGLPAAPAADEAAIDAFVDDVILPATAAAIVPDAPRSRTAAVVLALGTLLLAAGLLLDQLRQARTPIRL